MTDEEVRAMAREAATKSLVQQQPPPQQMATALQPEPQGPQYGVSQVTPQSNMMKDFVVPAVAPGIGAGVGGMVGGIPGAMAGGAAGEGVNQLLGLTDPSVMNMGLAGAAPALGGLGAVVGKMFGGKGAQALNALGPEEAAAFVGSLHPEIPSKFLFETATQDGALIPVQRTLKSIETMISDLGTSSIAEKANKPAVHALTRLKEKITASGGNMTPKQIQAELEGLGDMASQAEGKVKGAYKQVFKGLSNDLDDIASRADEVGTDAARTLKEARGVWKREQSIRDIDSALQDAYKFMKGQGGDRQFNAKAVLDELKDNDFIKSSFNPTELKEMQSLFEKLNRLPSLRPGAGQQAGSRNILKAPVAGSSIGAAASMLVGMGPTLGGVLGAGLGVAVPPLFEATRNIALAASMKTGRALLGKLLTNSGGELTPQALSILGAYAEAVRAGKEGAVAPQ